MSFGKELIKVVNDCLTSSGGDYDPARVFGYGIIALGGLEFLILTAYVTFKDGKFDGMQFATGLAAIGASLVAAGAGVWIKRQTENSPAVTGKEKEVSEVVK